MSSWIKDLKLNKINKSVWIFIVLFVCGLVFGILQCFYAPTSNDEAFYLTIPKRLLDGDALFVQEWHLSQLSSVLLLPILFLYQLIVPTQQGIILAFRVIYLVAHAVIAVFFYIKLHKYGIGASIAAIVYFLYTPVCIPALSYNTMGLGALVLLCMLLVDYEQTHNEALKGISIGILIACAVLCSPFLVLGYALYTAAVIAIKLMNKKEEKISLKLFSIKTWLYISAGCLLVLSLFIILLLAQGAFHKLFECIPHILNDPEHKGTFLFPLIRFLFGFLLRHKIVIALGFVGLLGIGAAVFVLVKDKKRMQHRGGYLTLISIPVLIGNVGLAVFANNISYVMVAINAVGIAAFIFTDKKNLQWLLVFWTVALIYAYCMFASSNTGLGAISQGLSVAALGSIFMIADCLKEMQVEEVRRPFLAVLALVLLIQPVAQITSQGIHSFTVGQEVVAYDFGCKSGIFATKSSIEEERKYYLDIQPILEDEDKSVVYFSFKIWMYMCGENEIGAYSGWLAGANETSYARLLEYYKINPHKVPDYIYLDGAYPWANENYQKVADELGYSVEKKDCGYLLSKMN